LRKLAFKKSVLIHAKYFYREVLFFFFYFSSQLFDYTPAVLHSPKLVQTPVSE